MKKKSQKPFGHVVLESIRRQFDANRGLNLRNGKFRLRTKHVKHLRFRKDYSTLIVTVADREALPCYRFCLADLYSGNMKLSRAMQWLRRHGAQEPWPHK